MSSRPDRLRRPARLLAALLALAACGERAPEPAEDPAPPPPTSVLLVSLDTLRADHLGAYGYERATAPSLRRLAREGVVFEDCVATANWTLPTHTSLFTGLSPLTHGVEEPSDRLPEGCPTLVEPFAAAGHRTAGFWSNPFLSADFGYARGFETYDHAATPDDRRAMVEPAGAPKGSTSGMRFPTPGPRREAYFAEQTSDLVTARGLDFLGALDDHEPFFLFLHYNDIHSDYIPPAPFDRTFDPDYDGDLSPENYPRHPDVRPGMDPRDLAWIRSLYDGEIRWVDHQLGRVLDRLRDAGRLDDTLVVVTADHGEGFFERGYKEHHYGLYRELLHIPLVMRLPRALPAGTRVADTVSQADIAPTILDLAGLPPLPHADGRSVAPLARGEPLPAQRPPVLSRTVLKPILEEPGDEMVSLTTPDFHAVLRTEVDGDRRLEVFDRRADPRELEPLPPGKRRRAAGAALNRAVEVLRARRGQLPWVDGAASHTVDEELLEHMRGWGYIK